MRARSGASFRPAPSASARAVSPHGIVVGRPVRSRASMRAMRNAAPSGPESAMSSAVTPA